MISWPCLIWHLPAGALHGRDQGDPSPHLRGHPVEPHRRHCAGVPVLASKSCAAIPRMHVSVSCILHDHQWSPVLL